MKLIVGGHFSSVFSGYIFLLQRQNHKTSNKSHLNAFFYVSTKTHANETSNKFRIYIQSILIIKHLFSHSVMYFYNNFINEFIFVNVREIVL